MSRPEGTVRVPVAHVSMQFSDTDAQMRHDAERLFARQAERGAWWITGTEAGGAKAQPLPVLLEAAAERYGYRMHRARGEWVAVARERIVRGSWRTGYEHALDAGASHTGNHTDRGVTWAEFENEVLGRITVGAGHMLTRGRPAPASPEYRRNLDLNRRFAEVVGEWGIEHGKGRALVFYNGDQNIVDRIADTFLGRADFTTSWDELGKWENTGHGNIDVLASWDHDGRVTALGVRALDDREFFLHTDHFLVEGAFAVRPLGRAA